MGLTLITGASGFVGNALIRTLILKGVSIRSAVREKRSGDDISVFPVGEIGPKTDWSKALKDVEIVIHLAARVHVMKDASKHPLAEFRRVNVEGTRRLVDMAEKAGVKRFVYVSSIGVNGAETLLPFNEFHDANPHNDYALSKWEAEQALHEISAKLGIEVVIVRPPMVYGNGAPGNFSKLVNLFLKGFPLPLATVKNLRSFIYVENLVDALILCAMHPNAAGQTYLVSDGDDVSTPDLLRKISEAMGKPLKLVPCSPILLRTVGRLIGKSNQLDRLLDNLQVDSNKIRRELGWHPPFNLDEGLNLSVNKLK